MRVLKFILERTNSYSLLEIDLSNDIVWFIDAIVNIYISRDTPTAVSQVGTSTDSIVEPTTM